MNKVVFEITVENKRYNCEDKNKKSKSNLVKLYTYGGNLESQVYPISISILKSKIHKNAINQSELVEASIIEFNKKIDESGSETFNSKYFDFEKRKKLLKLFSHEAMELVFDEINVFNYKLKKIIVELNPELYNIETFENEFTVPLILY